ncbi:hypothetical protein DPSP01_005733 [Paraphaeosphaeria sporulosa]
MSPPTFSCPTCGEEHPLHDTLPGGHSAHKPHCPFCLAHTLYRAIISAHPAPRPTPEQAEKNNMIKIRKIVLCTLAPVAVLAALAFRWQMRFWPGIAGGREGQGEDRALYVMLCIVGLAPCGCVLGFISAGVFYVYFCVRKTRARPGTE